MNDSRPLTMQRVASLWLPLALTWAMMAIEGPVLNAVISRLPEQRDNLAAYGIAIGIAMIIESPIIMLLSAAITLVRDNASWHALRRYGYRLCAWSTVGMAAVVLPPVFDFVTRTLLAIPPQLSEGLHSALLCLILWPASIGYRRLYQGLMISQGRSSQVAVASISRVASMAVMSLMLGQTGLLPGVTVAAFSLGFGVFVEAIATRFMARDVVRDIERTEPREGSEVLTPERITSFYRPLALTSVIGLAVNPLYSFFMTRFPSVLESMAVFPVIDSFVFQFRSPSFAYQETVVALADNTNHSRRVLFRFGLYLMAATSGVLALLALGPWLQYIYTVFPFRLSADLSRFATFPTTILILFPALTVWTTYLRGILINKRATRQVSVSTGIEVSAIFLSLLTLMFLGTVDGATAVCTSVIVGRMVSGMYVRYVIAATEGASI